ncbi:hypothetical protein RYX36_006392, partial [Vicia faba]
MAWRAPPRSLDNRARMMKEDEDLKNEIALSLNEDLKIPASDLIHNSNLIYEISYAGIEGQPIVLYHALSEETPFLVRPSHFLLTHTELLHPLTPPGTYNVKLTFDDEGGDQSGDYGCTAYVTFKDAYSQETACLLS